MHHRAQLGKKAEERVAQKLMQDGFTILAYNYRIKGAEIDLIASTHQLLVFVEVKMRQHNYFDLSHVITPSKQRKIMFGAKKFMMESAHAAKSFRFDVALLQGTQEDLLLTYIPNAFNESGCTW